LHAFDENVKVFHAGTQQLDEQVVTNGGRVLCVTALGETISQAQQRAYQQAEKINCDLIGDWRQRRSRLLLMILADRHPCGVHRDELIEAIWPNRDPSQARNNLNQAIHIVRRRFKDAGAPDPIEHIGERYRLQSAWNIEVDAHRFEELAGAALRSGEGGMVDEALALYRGDYLSDEPYEEWFQPGRHHLQRLYLDLMEQRGRRLLEIGSLGEAIADSRQVLRTEPTNESAHRRLMAALARQGRQTEALQAYERCRSTLSDEIGMSPSHETDALYEEILCGTAAGDREYSLSA
jgi:DNA-binding SARP family transcriptional activator